MIAKTAEYVVKKGKLDKVKEAIATFVRTVHVSEPGTKIYVSVQDKENESRFLHFMIFESEGAEQKHKNAGYTKEFSEILFPNCKSEPVYHEYIYIGGM